MKIWKQKWGDFTKDKNFIKPLIISSLFLILSLLINYIAGTYATERASLPVTDIILSNIRVFDVDGIFIYGSFIFWFFTALVLLYHPKKIIFTLKSIALFVIIRSVFVSLTHLGPFPTQVIVENIGFFNKFVQGLFFSIIHRLNLPCFRASLSDHSNAFWLRACPIIHGFLWGQRASVGSNDVYQLPWWFHAIERDSFLPNL